MSGAGWRLLVYERGEAPAREVELCAGLSLGRSPDNACVLADEHVGRFQLRVVEEGGALYLEELGASNPSRLGERALARGERLPLASGLRVTVGRSVLELVGPGPAEDPERTLAPAARGGTDPAATLVAPRAPDPERTRAPAGDLAGQATLAPRPTPPPPPAAPPPTPTAPATRPAPMPVRRAGEHPEDFEDPVGGSTLNLGAGGLADAAAARAFLETRRARLVLAGEVDRRSVPLDAVEVGIGREFGECRLSHPAVSARHARIRANVNLGTFQVEDLGSDNHTYLNGATLSPGVAQALAPESHLRFGTVDALFVVELDAESQPVPPATYRRALELLVAQGVVTKARAAEAAAQAQASGQHPGEVLVLAGALRVGAWRSAFEAARMGPGGAGSRLPEGSLKWVLLGAAVIVILGLLLSQL